MNILFVTTEVNQNSGWGVVSFNTIEYFSNIFGCKIDVITLAKAKNNPIIGVNYFEILTTVSDLKAKMFLLCMDFIRFIIKGGKFNYDYVHILVEPFIPFSLFYPKSTLFLTIHGTYSVSSFSSNNPHRKTYLKNLKRFDRVFAVSDYTLDKFKHATGFKNAVVIPLGVKLNNNLISADSKSNNITFVGHIKERKGLLILLEAINYLLIKCHVYSIHLFIIGSDLSDPHAHSDYLKKCLKFIGDNNLHKHITFTGQVSESELNSFYMNAKVNVLPSINSGLAFEGFGLVHLEANSNGTPSIGSFETGNESSIMQGISGYLVKQLDYVELANTIQMILDMDKNDYLTLSNSCIEFSKKNSWSVYGDALAKHYFS